MSAKDAEKGSTFQADSYIFRVEGRDAERSIWVTSSRNFSCLVLSPEMRNTARCSLGNIGCILRGSDGSFKRCLLVGLLDQKAQEKRPPRLCLAERGGNLEGFPVHCQSFHVDVEFLQKGRDNLMVYLPFTIVFEQNGVQLC